MNNETKIETQGRNVSRAELTLVSMLGGYSTGVIAERAVNMFDQGLPARISVSSAVLAVTAVATAVFYGRD